MKNEKPVKIINRKLRKSKSECSLKKINLKNFLRTDSYKKETKKLDKNLKKIRRRKLIKQKKKIKKNLIDLKYIYKKKRKIIIQEKNNSFENRIKNIKKKNIQKRKKIFKKKNLKKQIIFKSKRNILSFDFFYKENHKLMIPSSLKKKLNNIICDEDFDTDDEIIKKSQRKLLLNLFNEFSKDVKKKIKFPVF